jgi:hypothetical protein|tara:strand:+ start:800 stop:973 length:174 start_codon:yes stop_codon:yes gene_type:complete
MSPDEANALMQVMSNKINQLTQQNLMYESKIMYLNKLLQDLQPKPETSEEDSYTTEE